MVPGAGLETLSKPLILMATTKSTQIRSTTDSTGSYLSFFGLEPGK